MPSPTPPTGPTALSTAVFSVSSTPPASRPRPIPTPAATPAPSEPPTSPSTRLATSGSVSSSPILNRVRISRPTTTFAVVWHARSPPWWSLSTTASPRSTATRLSMRTGSMSSGSSTSRPMSCRKMLTCRVVFWRETAPARIWLTTWPNVFATPNLITSS
ncbi:probable carboxylesterase 18 [Phtheirospermum japonicum]|uniref:Probable carboxylesterase 18 n=1 Tax=Phtheirospermum japonicum TaxID=374723 RepID=A0A830BSK0_9LAMI|nr:probable carboxylesterase 18 [Phtheirospermum japonicum]